MPTYACVWENKNVTIVNATDRKKAVELLDELAEVKEEKLVRLKSSIMFTLRGNEAGEWEYIAEGLGEELDVELRELVLGEQRFASEDHH